MVNSELKSNRFGVDLTILLKSCFQKKIIITGNNQLNIGE